MFTIFYLLKARANNLGKWIIPRYVDPEDDSVVAEWGPQDYARDLWDHICTHKVYRDEVVEEAYLCYGGKLVDNNTQVTEYTVCEKFKDGKRSVLLNPVPMKKEVPVVVETPVVTVPASELEDDDETEVITEVDDDETEESGQESGQSVQIDDTEDTKEDNQDTEESEDPDNVEEEFD